eukprot:gene22836-biopygen16290
MPIIWRNQPTSSCAHHMCHQAEGRVPLKAGVLNGDVVSGRVAGLLRVLVAPAVPQFPRLGSFFADAAAARPTGKFPMDTGETAKSPKPLS